MSKMDPGYEDQKGNATIHPKVRFAKHLSLCHCFWFYFVTYMLSFWVYFVTYMLA